MKIQANLIMERRNALLILLRDRWRIFAFERFPQRNELTLNIYFAPEDEIETYMENMMYQGQKVTVKNIGIDSPEYCLKIDEQEITMQTDGDGYWGAKQIAATCLTAFLQTTLLYLGLMTFQDHMLLGLGIMLSANEVPRIAQQFGLDSSEKHLHLMVS